MSPTAARPRAREGKAERKSQKTQRERGKRERTYHGHLLAVRLTKRFRPSNLSGIALLLKAFVTLWPAEVKLLRQGEEKKETTESRENNIKVSSCMRS